MQDIAFQLRRRVAYIHRRFREWAVVGKGLVSTRHPLMAHIIPIRRCNLSWTYCIGYVGLSRPGRVGRRRHRSDRLACLGSSVVAMSGGEPLLHPQLDEIISHIRSHGMMAGMITNGYLLTA